MRRSLAVVALLALLSAPQDAIAKKRKRVTPSPSPTPAAAAGASPGSRAAEATVTPSGTPAPAGVAPLAAPSVPPTTPKRPITPSVPTPAPPTPAPPTPAPTPEPGRITGKVSLAEKDGLKPGEGTIVFVDRVAPELWSATARSAPGASTITMKDKRFEPRVLPVLVADPVHFPNLDPIFHNVFSLSGKNKFDLGLYKDGKSKDQTFSEPGIVRMFCNIHPGMTAFAVVLQNPYFASVAANGTYTIKDLPPGRYKLRAWHERAAEAQLDLAVEPGATVRGDFALDASKFKLLPHKNKFGQDYSKDGY